MMQKTGFFGAVWKQLYPHVLSGLVEFGHYAILWIGVSAVHFVRIIATAFGVDPEIMRPVSFMERWVWIATFAAFFFRVLIRVWRVTWH